MGRTGRKEGEGSEGGSWGKRNRTLRGENTNRTRRPCCEGTRRKGESQRWRRTWRTGVGNESGENRTQGRGRKLEGNTPGTRAGRPVEDRYRSRNKMVIIAMEGIEKGDGGAISRGILPKRPEEWQRDPRGPGVVYPGNPSLTRRNRTLRSTQGGKLPQAEPPAAPTLFWPIQTIISGNQVTLCVSCHGLWPDPLVELLVCEHLQLQGALPERESILMSVLCYLCCIIVAYVGI